MTAQRGHHARTSLNDDGPPTDELLRPDPPSPRRVGTHVTAVVRRWLHPAGVRSRGVLIVAVLGVVLIAVIAVSYRIADSDAAGDNTADAHQLTYRATSSERTVMVTYSQGNNGLDGQATAASPWSTTATVTGSIAVLTVTSGNSDRVNSVTCTIQDTNTGQTLVSNAVPPSTGATVTCVTGNLRA